LLGECGYFIVTLFLLSIIVVGQEEYLPVPGFPVAFLILQVFLNRCRKKETCGKKTENQFLYKKKKLKGL
jgi:hypothetical protein